MIKAEPTILTISQLNAYIRSLIDGDMYMSSLFVIGEISNFTNHYRTGHYYMTLKDEKSSIKAVMFKTAAQRLRFMPENGMRVIALGRVSVFERDGQYQLYIDDMQPDGLGSLNLAFEQLKEKLSKEGLFDEKYKKEIPEIPQKIGVITSPTGAAIRDIFNVLSRRFPLAEVIVGGVEVQGSNASSSMVKTLREFDELQCVDVIIIGRGGGSVEELWAFNDEKLARAIFDCSIPVISAVGHETDYTICDFVSDLRAPTPSAAAELAVPDIREHISYIIALKCTLNDIINDFISGNKKELERLINNKNFVDPKRKIDDNRLYLDSIISSLEKTYKAKINSEKVNLSAILGRFDAINPLKVLMRGYSIATKNNENVSSIKQLKTGDKIDLRLSDGSVLCEIIGGEV